MITSSCGRFILGQTLTIGLYAQRNDCSFIDAGDATLRIVLPDGNHVDLSVPTPRDVGKYSAEYTPTLTGTHTYRWALNRGTNTNTSIGTFKVVSYGI